MLPGFLVAPSPLLPCSPAPPAEETALFRLRVQGCRATRIQPGRSSGTELQARELKGCMA